MKKLLLISIIFLMLPFFQGQVFASEDLSTIRLKTDFNIWKVNLNRHQWLTETQKLNWLGLDVRLPTDLAADNGSSLDSYLSNEVVADIDEEAVKAYLDKYVAPELHRDKQDVSISLDENGEVVFDGFAFSGQDVDYDKSMEVIRQALLTGEPEIRLPLKTTPPTVTVLDDSLREMGIVDLISTGETDFAGSPYNRRINIAIGLSKFNGELIPPGTESGAGEILGHIGPETGYRKELVIVGDKTIPEYGGGLCQVSTTIYRSLLFGGFPITERRNHSYAVSYYDPQGLDATIYPPAVDIKFVNDTLGYILLQTTTVDNKAYSNIYGTKPDRYVDLIGPYYYDYKRAPPPKVEYTTELEPGETRQVGGAHAGFKADWFRRITYADEALADKVERIHSNYQARPKYTQIGELPSIPVDISENGT